MPAVRPGRTPPARAAGAASASNHAAQACLLGLCGAVLPSTLTAQRGGAAQDPAADALEAVLNRYGRRQGGLAGCCASRVVRVQCSVCEPTSGDLRDLVPRLPAGRGRDLTCQLTRSVPTPSPCPWLQHGRAVTARRRLFGAPPAARSAALLPREYAACAPRAFGHAGAAHCRGWLESTQGARVWRFALG